MIRHSIIILLSELAIYAYRDLWPLATIADRPLDVEEGWILWTRIGALIFTALIVPVSIPTVYSPVDPKVSLCVFLVQSLLSDPWLIPLFFQSPAIYVNPEQTASILSLATFTYLSSTISAANRTDHLSPEEMPPISDYDTAQALAERSFPVCYNLVYMTGHPDTYVGPDFRIR
jgi:hypothetical protein